MPAPSENQGQTTMMNCNSNGLTDTRTYDQDYRLTGITDPNILSWTLGHNADDDITGITDNLVGSNSQILGYDNLNRLNAGSGNYGSLSYKYDADGNRNQGIVNGITTNYTYATGNRLTKVNATTRSYDADGSLTGDGTFTYSYDDSERLGSVTKTGTTASYIYNGLGQRAEKTVNGATTVFIYDEPGHLIGEYTPSGTLIAEHIWLGNQPIGVITSTGLYYVQTDQLDTTRAITNSSKQLVWEWSSDPFGTTAPNQNPSGLGTFTFNLRFPGQYYDAETGHNYNYFRDYDPIIGRYVESDPTGLLGGLNTYTYVDVDPLKFADLVGLSKCNCRANPLSKKYLSVKVAWYGALQQWSCNYDCTDATGNSSSVTATFSARLLLHYFASNDTPPAEICPGITYITRYSDASWFHEEIDQILNIDPDASNIPELRSWAGQHCESCQRH